MLNRNVKNKTHVAYKRCFALPRSRRLFQLLSSRARTLIFITNIKPHRVEERRDETENSREEMSMLEPQSAGRQKRRCKIQIIHDRISKLAMPFADFGLADDDDDD